MILLLPLALAQAPADVVPDEGRMPAWEIGESNPDVFDVIGAMDQAIQRRRDGDLAGARLLLTSIEREVLPAQRPWWLYQLGICEELAWKPDAARALYEEAIRLYEAGASGADTPGTAADARFRLALVLEDLGRDDEALAQMQLLAKLRGLDEADAATVALQRGIALVNAGRVRKGLTLLQDTLVPLDRTEPAGAATSGHRSHTWLRAKARWVIARELLDTADAYTLTGGEHRVVRRLTKRAEHIQAAEEQIITLIGLEEPEWILQSLLDLGDSYANLADDLERAPVPRRLDPGASAVYQLEIKGKVKNVRDKAFHAYDQGVALAVRLGFESPKVATLKDRRDAMWATGR